MTAIASQVVYMLINQLVPCQLQSFEITWTPAVLASSEPDLAACKAALHNLVLRLTWAHTLCGHWAMYILRTALTGRSLQHRSSHYDN